MQVMENREKYKVNYAKLDLGNEDIQVCGFGNRDEVLSFLLQIFEYNKNKKIVYLISFEAPNVNEVFISHDWESLINFIEGVMFAEQSSTDYYIQEYSSYEAAYSVALMMKETNELCYDNNL